MTGDRVGVVNPISSPGPPRPLETFTTPVMSCVTWIRLLDQPGSTHVTPESKRPPPVGVGSEAFPSHVTLSLLSCTFTSHPVRGGGGDTEGIVDVGETPRVTLRSSSRRRLSTAHVDVDTVVPTPTEKTSILTSPPSKTGKGTETRVQGFLPIGR